MTLKTGSFESEKNDIIERAMFLVNETRTADDVINKMPSFIGRHFQGEWSIYTLSMTSLSLANIATLYPEMKRWAYLCIDGLIQTALSDEIKEYDIRMCGDDPNKGHLSYYGLVALMISAYRSASDDGKYNLLHASLCDKLYRQISSSENLNIETYPGQPIYVPDMTAAIASLAIYPSGYYKPFAEEWIDYMRHNYIDPETGLLVSTIGGCKGDVLGSYTALTLYYLSFIDEEFAYEQYCLFKKHFVKSGVLSGVKEKLDGTNDTKFLIDSGPIIFGLSPSGTSFGIGAATYFNDKSTRKKMLRTGEIAGFTVFTKKSRHYLLSDIALVGEAITLAMRTAVKWNSRNQSPFDWHHPLPVD